jgi:hypothetical protein
MQAFQNQRAAYSRLVAGAANKESTPWNILWGTFFYQASPVVVSVSKYTGSYDTDFGGDFCNRWT